MSIQFDVDEFIDLFEKEEDAVDMHHSLFSIPSYYQSLPVVPCIKTLKEINHAN